MQEASLAIQNSENGPAATLPATCLGRCRTGKQGFPLRSGARHLREQVRPQMALIRWRKRVRSPLLLRGEHQCL
jgi:hypothetical protein